ncbi:MAG: biotin--[acetyl-CoA-carboxylase] ligase [Pseudomonadota bacterium]
MSAPTPSDRLTIPPGWQVQHHDELPSTNTELMARAVAGTAEPGVVLVATQQTGGRGRQGRQWEAPAGGLYMSCLIADHEGWGTRWSLVVGLAAHQALAGLDPTLGADLRLKWPNDVYLDDRKLAGILIERAGMDEPWRLVIGLGVNVVRPDQPRADAAYVQDYAPTVLVADLLPRVLTALDGLRRQFAKSGPDMIRQAWLAHAWRLGGAVSCHVNGQKITGLFRDLDRDGAMILERDDGQVQRISGGDVHFGADHARGSS